MKIKASTFGLALLALIALYHFNAMASLLSEDRKFDDSDRYWTEVHDAGYDTQATKSRAARTGYRHVATCVEATIATSSAAQTPLTITLKDGSTNLAAWKVSAPANGQGGISKCGLKLIGTASTAMTLAFSGAGVTSSNQAVTLMGYDVK